MERKEATPSFAGGMLMGGKGGGAPQKKEGIERGTTTSGTETGNFHKEDRDKRTLTKEKKKGGTLVK